MRARMRLLDMLSVAAAGPLQTPTRTSLLTPNECGTSTHLGLTRPSIASAKRHRWTGASACLHPQDVITLTQA